MSNTDAEVLSNMMLKSVEPEFGIEASLYTAGWNDAIDAIIHLPATQPEPCEYCNEDSDGYVKPIEKNNHAFVRFGASGWELSMRANGWRGSAKIRFCPMCGRNLSMQSKGKRIWKGSKNEGFWTCSECGQKFYQGYGNENFCPNCEKRMMKGEKNENNL